MQRRDASSLARAAAALGFRSLPRVELCIDCVLCAVFLLARVVGYATPLGLCHQTIPHTHPLTPPQIRAGADAPVAGRMDWVLRASLAAGGSHHAHAGHPGLWAEPGVGAQAGGGRAAQPGAHAGVRGGEREGQGAVGPSGRERCLQQTLVSSVSVTLIRAIEEVDTEQCWMLCWMLASSVLRTPGLVKQRRDKECVVESWLLVRPTLFFAVRILFPEYLSMAALQSSGLRTGSALSASRVSLRGAALRAPTSALPRHARHRAVRVAAGLVQKLTAEEVRAHKGRSLSRHLRPGLALATAGGCHCGARPTAHRRLLRDLVRASAVSPAPAA